MALLTVRAVVLLSAAAALALWMLPGIYSFWTARKLGLQPGLTALFLTQGVLAAGWNTAGWVLLASNEHRTLAWWAVANATLTVVLATVLAPRHGVLGVAAATLLGDLACGAGCLSAAGGPSAAPAGPQGVLGDPAPAAGGASRRRPALPRVSHGGGRRHADPYRKDDGPCAGVPDRAAGAGQGGPGLDPGPLPSTARRGKTVKGRRMARISTGEREGGFVSSMRTHGRGGLRAPGFL